MANRLAGRPLLLLARILGVVGASLFFAAFVVLVFVAPRYEESNVLIPAAINVFFAILVVQAVFRIEPALLFLALVGSLLLGSGWYLVLIAFDGSPLGWTSVGYLLYLSSGLLLLGARSAGARTHAED